QLDEPCHAHRGHTTGDRRDAKYSHQWRKTEGRETERPGSSSRAKRSSRPGTRMKPREFLQVDPASLHLPGSRRDGADPVKLQRQLAKHGTSIEGMPPLEVKRGTDGE